MFDGMKSNRYERNSRDLTNKEVTILIIVFMLAMGWFGS